MRKEKRIQLKVRKMKKEQYLCIFFIPFLLMALDSAAQEKTKKTQIGRWPWVIGISGLGTTETNKANKANG